MESEWYRRIFPGTRLSREKNTETNFETTRGGFRFATSFGGTLTGIGGDVIIVDDPLSSGDAFSEAKRTASNEWFDSVVYSRLDDKREGVIIIASQRLHVDDLSGHVLRSGSWNQLSLPAIAEVEERIQIGPRRFHTRRPGDLLHEEREPRAVLDRFKADSGNYEFSAHYQQCPTPEDGEIIKWEWFEFFDEVPTRRPGDQIVLTWDTALKSGNYTDYSVCLIFLVRGKDYYLLDVFRERLNYPELKHHIIRLADAYRAHAYIIEDKGSGTSVIADIRHSEYANISNPIAYLPVADKVTRMMAQSAKLEARQVHLPRRAPWLGEFHDEVLQFPHGRHDDQVDALAQFLDWIDQHQRYRTIVEELDI
jgi:predicted phage terminase large subunit-like protein